MQLGDLEAAITSLPLPSARERAHPDRDAVKALRSGVESAVADDRFVVDCIAHEVDSLAAGRPLRGLNPFLVVPGLGVRVAFGYWPPGARAGVHEHTAWTVTAVCRNALRVATFDRDATYRTGRLVEKRDFGAAQGDAGYIYDPAIHEPRNASSRWSLSLHVTSPRDGEPVDDFECTPPMPSPQSGPAHDDPYWEVIRRRRRQTMFHYLTTLLVDTDLPEARAPLAACARLGAGRTRRLAARAGGLPRHAPRSDSIVLRRAVPAVETWWWSDGGRVHLESMSSAGIQREAVAAGAAGEVVRHLADRGVVDLADWRHHLTHDERVALADALEQTGLFDVEEP